MRPCVGVPALHIAPFCTMAEIKNGTYTLADIELFNQAIHELIESAQDV